MAFDSSIELIFSAIGMRKAAIDVRGEIWARGCIFPREAYQEESGVDKLHERAHGSVSAAHAMYDL